MYEEFVRNRITQLRLQKGVSEYQMSYDLGHSRGYIYNISSGKSLPPLSEFFSIFEYFYITPQEIFDEKRDYPALVQKTIAGLTELPDDDLLLMLTLVTRFNQKN